MDGMNLTKEIIGKTFQEVFSGERGAHLTNYYQQVVNTNKLLTYEDAYLTDADEWRFSKTELLSLPEDHCNSTRIVATIKDITREKQEQVSKEKAWKEIIASRKRYES